MEQLLTTPVSPLQIIIGKVAPYIGVALLDGILVLLFAVFHFGVPLTGSIALLFLFGIIYIVAALSLGVLISTLVKTQQLAMMAALVVTVLPSVMLSGFIFDTKNFPPVLQFISYLIPAKYFLLIIRGIMLKGSGIEVLWPYAGALVFLTLALLLVAAKKFQIRIG
jgi:ABC-2 type transport system permease protein